MTGLCELCRRGTMSLFRTVDGVDYLACNACESILADRTALDRGGTDLSRKYDDSYWRNEVSAARERSFGSSLLRVAELFRMARIPLRRIVDISAGDGSLLTALDLLLPEISDMFYGIEPFPPPLAFRSSHRNYRVGHVHDLDGTFDGGVCIEVIEHLFPDTLAELLRTLATKSNPGAVYYFNSAQPSFVIERDLGYLDPFGRGHVASYSVEGVRPLFAAAGFTVQTLPGRDWAFLAEYGRYEVETTDQMLTRMWHPIEANMVRLRPCRFGPMFIAAGIESARCYLEAATAVERTRWALSLQAQHV